MVVEVFTPPTPAYHSRNPTIFLAGTIDNGQSEDWQIGFAKKLETMTADDVTIYNPRRAAWDATLVQDISNKTFREQVEWELEHIDDANFVVMNFLPGSLSPITLMELGYLAGGDSPCRTLVCCPEGFWRRGNVQVMCARHMIDLYDDMDTLMVDLVDQIEALV